MCSHACLTYSFAVCCSSANTHQTRSVCSVCVKSSWLVIWLKNNSKLRQPTHNDQLWSARAPTLPHAHAHTHQCIWPTWSKTEGIVVQCYSPILFLLIVFFLPVSLSPLRLFLHLLFRSQIPLPSPLLLFSSSQSYQLLSISELGCSKVNVCAVHMSVWNL